MIKRYFLKIICCLFISQSLAQPIQELNSGGKISLRGLSVVDNNIIWVSGSKGTVGKSLDGGKTWKWMKVKGYKKFDFRDIEAFDENTAIIMAVAEPAYILKTTDGGKKWKEVYEKKTKGMFLDAMDFGFSTSLEMTTGYVVGDPIDGKFFLARTTDKGESWQEVYGGGGSTDSSEACFASSGTNVRMFKHNLVFVSGGLSSNLIYVERGIDGVGDNFGDSKTLTSKYKLPLIQGTSSTGANSIAVKDSLTFIVVGGDFTNDAATPNCAITNDGGKTWTLPEKAPTGYKSCVEYLYGNVWVCCGLTGIDVSNDNGKTWNQISKVSYHTCRKAKKGNAVYFSGNGSRIGCFASRSR